MKPFIKWVGGKRQLLPDLRAKLPNDFNRYFEPFLGGGSLYFDLELDTDCFLGDLNSELVNAYLQIQKNPKPIKTITDQFINNERFHSLIRNMDRDKPRFDKLSLSFRAARFLFLVRTSHSGMWRVNSKGQHNAPYAVGNKNVVFPEKLIYPCSELLKKNAFLCCGNYEISLKDAEKDDFVYLDPPYHAGFTAYALYENNFQHKLAIFCRHLDAKKIKFMVSNSYTPLTNELYSAFNIHVVEANRVINSKVSKRGKVKEILVTNY